MICNCCYYSVTKIADARSPFMEKLLGKNCTHEVNAKFCEACLETFLNAWRGIRTEENPQIELLKKLLKGPINTERMKHDGSIGRILPTLETKLWLADYIFLKNGWISLSQKGLELCSVLGLLK